MNAFVLNLHFERLLNYNLSSRSNYSGDFTQGTVMSFVTPEIRIVESEKLAQQSATSTLKAIARAYPGKLFCTLSLVALENALLLAYPLFAIDVGGGHAWSYPWGFIALAGPLSMYLLLVHVSGIPPLEAHMLRSRGDPFRAYQARVNAFWPGFPRTSRHVEAS